MGENQQNLSIILDNENNFVEFFENIKLTDILLHKDFLKNVKEGNDFLINFLLNNISELLNLAISIEPKKVTISAFYFFLFGNKRIIEEIRNSNLFYAKVSMLLSELNPNPIQIHRSVTIAAIILTENLTTFPPTCGFIFQLLPFLYEISVLAFFEKILFPNTQNLIIHEWLNFMKFSDIIFNEINLLHPKDYFSNNSIKYIHLLKIIRLSLKSQILENSFRDCRIFSSIIKPFEELPSNLEDEKWLTILSLYNFKTFDFINSYFIKTLHLIIEDNINMNQSRVCAILLLSEMIKTDQQIISFIIKEKIGVIFIQLIFQFPNHSIMFNSIIQFIINSLNFFQLSEHLINNLIQPLLFECLNSSNRNLISFSYKIIDIYYEFSKNNENIQILLLNIKGLKKFLNNQFENYKSLLINFYGGKII